MIFIDRKECLNFLLRHKDKQVIKFISGIKGCGRTTLLDTYKDYFIKTGISKEQLISINLEDIATIQGAAGTGKTLIALEAAKRFSFKGDKVLFLCFNKLLYEHLKFDCPIKNVDFFNIHSFIKDITQTQSDL